MSTIQGVPDISKWHVKVRTDIERGGVPGAANHIEVGARENINITQIHGVEEHEFDLPPGSHDFSLISTGQEIYAGQRDNFQSPKREDYHWREHW